MKKKVECPYCGNLIEFNLYGIKDDKCKEYGWFLPPEALNEDDKK